jgi:hypothetical protein
MTSYTTFYTTINDLFEAFDKWVPWTTKEAPGTLANLWLQQGGLKGRLLLLLFRLASERPSSELTLQASKVRSESLGRTSG